jgi:hypothetical protein
MTQLKLWDAAANGGAGAWVAASIGTQGASGTVAVSSPLTLSGSSTAATIGLDQTALSLQQSQVANLTTDLASKVPADAYVSYTGASTRWVDTIPRHQVGSSQAVGTNLWVSFFTPVKDITVTGMILSSGGTAGTSVTYVSYGLYSFPDENSLNLVAVTDTSATAYTALGVSSIVRTAGQNTATVTVLSHGFSNGNSIRFFGTGLAEFDNLSFSITVVDTNSFTITTTNSTQILLSDLVNGMCGISTTGFQATYTPYYKPFTSYPSGSGTSYTLQAGKRYGVAFLARAGGTAPTFLCVNIPASTPFGSLTPRLLGAKGAYTTGDITSSTAAALFNTGTQSMIWARLVI